jgi:1-acyl-sn-glycerol-3-phosphate acyltransferase
MRARSILYAIWYYGLTTVCAIVYIPLLPLPRAALRRGIRIWARLLIWGMRVIGGVRLEVRGLEHLPKGVPVLLAAKHQSMFDIIPAFAYMPDALFVMRREFMRIPVFGWHNLKHGTIVINREGHAQALRKMMADARERFKEPRQLLIFPEGTRTAPGAPPNYKPGVAGMYRDLNVPCVPVATNTGVHVSTSGVAKSPGLVIYEVLEPIPAGLKRADFMRILEDRIETASNTLFQAATKQ